MDRSLTKVLMLDSHPQASKTGSGQGDKHDSSLITCLQTAHYQEKNNITTCCVFDHTHCLCCALPGRKPTLCLRRLETCADDCTKGPRKCKRRQLKGEEDKQRSDKCFSCLLSSEQLGHLRGGSCASVLNLKSCCCIMTGSGFRLVSNYMCPPACGSVNVMYALESE